MSYIAKFNPYSMDNETILAVATGRKYLLNQVLGTLTDNLETSSVAQHFVIRGPRGMGKSFFLKYLQINFNNTEKFKNCDFLLLPEEQNNINSPSDLIKLILNQAKGHSGEKITSLWEEPEDVWQNELSKLKKYISEKKKLHNNYMLVVVIENLNDFLRNIKSEKKTEKLYESRFRHLLEKIKYFTVIGATPVIESEATDGDYNSRLFHAFKKYKLRTWTEDDYSKYFERRKNVKIEEQGVTFSKEQTALMKAKLKALSQFTGGSPRMAVVLTNLLLDDDLISTVKTLFGLIDDLTPYYQDLTKSIPPKSKILFDTLIRKGENLSQSELAKMVGATQSKVSKAFLWLKYNGYIIGKKRMNSPAFSYKVADRIHVLYYQLREIHHNKKITPIWLLSDFLVAFYQENELHSYANKYLTEQPGGEANDIAKVYLMSAGLYKEEQLPDFEKSEDWLEYIKEFQNLKDTKSEPKELKSIEETIILNKLMLKKYKKDKNVYEQIFYLSRIAMDLRELKKHKEAIEYQFKIYELRKQKKNIPEQAWSLYEIGLNYRELKEYRKAIEYHKKSFELYNQENNFHLKVWNLELIGINYDYLNEHNKAIDFCKKAYNLNILENRISGQSFDLVLIARSFKKLKKHKEAIEYIKKAYELNKQTNNIDEQAWNLGHIGENYILLNKWNKAIELLKPDFEENEQIIKGFGGAINFTKKNTGISKAFEVGNRLLNLIKDKKDILNVNITISYLFAKLLNDDISKNLFIDICEEALYIFPEKDTQLIINAAMHSVKYIESGKDEKYLEKLDPDTAIAIEAIVKEANL
ncbi:MAG: tetratricopeptide repeat protein [Bacteroidales bacterium]|nr:tetratricopeptide repeat protein [Bacteroidales bacterium]